MKIIFLDFDGVLLNADSFRGASGLHAKPSPACIAALNRITDETNARIVVSSTWRIGLQVIELRELLKGWGVTGVVIDRTPCFWSERGTEIDFWLKNYRREDVTEFVILDDDADMLELAPRLIKTEFMDGLTEADADRAINLLRPAL